MFGADIDWGLFGLWYVAFLFSLTVHEASHALAALKLGDPTAYRGGQVTLNPLPHMRREPFGTIVVPALSYIFAGWMMGWASAPYDPVWADRHPRRAGWMALAGPASRSPVRRESSRPQPGRHRPVPSPVPPRHQSNSP